MESAEFTQTKSLILRILVSSEIHMVLADLQTIRGTTENFCCFTNYKLFYKSEDYAPASKCDVLTALHTRRLRIDQCFRKQSTSQGIMGQWLVLLFSLKMSTAQR